MLQKCPRYQPRLFKAHNLLCTHLWGTMDQFECKMKISEEPPNKKSLALGHFTKKGYAILTRSITLKTNVSADLSVKLRYCFLSLELTAPIYFKSSINFSGFFLSPLDNQSSHPLLPQPICLPCIALSFSTVVFDAVLL